jgi:CPA2 family monovalent cation:H+ antiporter-2
LSLKVTSEFLYPIAVAVSALTTLVTPYLLRSSNQVVAWFDRVLPSPAKAWLDLYTQWVGGSRARSSVGIHLARKWTWQITLNLILVTGIFIGAAALRHHALQWWPDMPRGEDGVKALLWLGAMLLSLPLLVATFLKLRALSMLLSEMSGRRTAGGENHAALGSIVANTILSAGCLVLTLILFLLSSAILPSWNLLAVLVLIVAGSAVLLWRWFTRLYSRAQFALKETLSQPPAAERVPRATVLPAILRDAQITPLRLSEEMPAAGKFIGELGLRTHTGASIVGIQRDGANIINPGPDEELRAGDEVLLLGNRAHLDSARKLLTQKQGTTQPEGRPGR